MNDLQWLSRTELLIGKEKLMKLQNSHVLIVGMGGVGSYAAEFICRSGIGTMTIVDGDIVDPTNRNRQLRFIKCLIRLFLSLLLICLKALNL